MTTPRGPKPYSSDGSSRTDQVKHRAEDALHNATQTAAGAFGRLTASLRGARDRRSAARVAHRPDGTPVSPSPSGRARGGPGANGRAAGGPLAALKARWAEAVQEGKLAAREKEAEVRAAYERRVRHDPHLHAEQHRGKVDAPAMQPRTLPPSGQPPGEKK